MEFFTLRGQSCDKLSKKAFNLVPFLHKVKWNLTPFGTRLEWMMMEPAYDFP